MTQPSAAQAARTSAATAAPARSSRFAGGFGSMLMGGLIGAGLFGLLSGHGLFGGMSGLASMLGLLLQVGLIAGAIWLVMSFFRNRQQPAMAGAGAGPASSMAPRRPDAQARTSSYAAGGAGAGAPAIEKADFDTFERLLGDVQEVYSREDTAGLRRVATPEMMSFLSDDLAQNAKNGVRNELSGTRLLQGDLAESWTEGNEDYATVAMRFELIDTMVDRTSGRVVSGNANVAQEATEIWTFVRPRDGGASAWKLSAIQQTS